MKKLIPAYVISFVMSFMLFIFEPITMYANNINDFWFDLYIMLKPVMLMFFASFCFFDFVFTIIYLINKKVSKKLTFYNISVLLFFIVFICLYIHGNFLANNLPPLDGSKIIWEDYTKISVVSVFTILAVSMGVLFSTIKFKFEKMLKMSVYISIAVLVMLFSSFVTTLMTPHLFDPKVVAVATHENFNKVSSKKNFIIFVMDAVDSVMFDEVMSNDKEFKNVFDDFTYYKDTMSTYPYTRDSVPFILSGIWNENKNKESFRDYYNRALDNSLLLKELYKKEYNMNIYDYELQWGSPESKKISNLRLTAKKIKYKKYIKNQMKYILFKYLPYPLKRYSSIETLNFNNSKMDDDFDVYRWGDKRIYKRIQEDYEKTDEKIFKFVHIEGAHLPLNLNRNVETIEDGDYYQKLEASLTIVKTYLNKLKENGAYDNSVIIVMSDHGFVLGNLRIGRQNPILFIKGVDEHHKMQRSSKAISFVDLNDAYIDLLNDKKSSDLFKDIGEKRERRFLWYRYSREYHMVEYIQTGKAWDEDTLIPTGKVFDL